jgi:hypothetical protein
VGKPPRIWQPNRLHTDISRKGETVFLNKKKRSERMIACSFASLVSFSRDMKKKKLHFREKK